MTFFQRISVCFIVFWVVSGCSAVPDYLIPSSNEIKAPKSDKPFEEYVRESEQNILDVITAHQKAENYQGAYTHSQAAEMRAPFQRPTSEIDRCDRKNDGYNKGFLLVHGLTDSPYLMKGIADSIQNKYPCALIRAIILPGHGTIPGDSLVMRHKDWMKSTDYGVHSFDAIDSIDSLFVVSFSTGAPLLIRHIAEQNNSSKIKGAIFLSAAIEAKSRFAPISPYIQYIWKWLDKTNEQDAVRYESFSTHAGAEFYLLTKVLDNKRYDFNLPLFIVISADDATVSAEAALKYFCRAKEKNKKLLWYEYKDSTEPFENVFSGSEKCKEKVIVRTVKEVSPKRPQFVSFSHTSLSMPPDDPHYGKDGKYKQCKSYFSLSEPDNEEFEKCINQETENFYIGEATKGLKKRAEDESKPLRRGTYNPDYYYMTEQIFEFLNSIE